MNLKRTIAIAILAVAPIGIAACAPGTSPGQCYGNCVDPTPPHDQPDNTGPTCTPTYDKAGSVYC